MNETHPNPVNLLSCPPVSPLVCCQTLYLKLTYFLSLTRCSFGVLCQLTRLFILSQIQHYSFLQNYDRAFIRNYFDRVSATPSLSSHRRHLILLGRSQRKGESGSQTDAKKDALSSSCRVCPFCALSPPSRSVPTGMFFLHPGSLSPSPLTWGSLIPLGP